MLFRMVRSILTLLIACSYEEFKVAVGVALAARGVRVEEQATSSAVLAPSAKRKASEPLAVIDLTSGISLDPHLVDRATKTIAFLVDGTTKNRQLLTRLLSLSVRLEFNSRFPICLDAR
jgi:hypothetical protein